MVLAEPNVQHWRRSGLVALWISALVIVCDQWTKWFVVSALVPHQPVAVAPLINLTLTYNTGAAFSLLSQASGWQRWFFAAVAGIVSVVIIYWLRKTPGEERLTAFSLALILGGAVANAYDRVMLGHVIDFIDVYVNDWHWPAFNVADSAITVGAVLMIIDTIRGGGRHRP
jgi:signal peptidase II